MLGINTIKEKVLYELQQDAKFRQDLIYILFEDEAIKEHVRHKIK